MPPSFESHPSDSDMPKKTISTDKAPIPVGPYSQGVVSSGQNLVFLSGQVGLIPGTKELIKGGISEETRQTLENLSNILRAAGLAPEHVVKTTVFLKDINDFGAMNKIYAEFFKSNYPARATVEVSALPLGARVEIEAIAIID